MTIAITPSSSRRSSGRKAGRWSPGPRPRPSRSRPPCSSTGVRRPRLPDLDGYQLIEQLRAAGVRAACHHDQSGDRRTRLHAIRRRRWLPAEPFRSRACSRSSTRSAAEPAERQIEPVCARPAALALTDLRAIRNRHAACQAWLPRSPTCRGNQPFSPRRSRSGSPDAASGIVRDDTPVMDERRGVRGPHGRALEQRDVDAVNRA